MITLTKKQEEFLASKARYKFANWGRRSGKTTMFAYEALGTALSKDNARITYYAPTISDAREIAWGMFQEVFGPLIVKKNETLLEMTVMTKTGGNSTVVLRGWESVVISEKGRGVENDLLIFDEVAFCRNFKQHWYKTLEPTLLTSKGRAVFASTPDGFNHWYELCTEAQGKDDYFYLHATSYDNPFNDPEDLERIKKERTDDAFAQEYLADFRKQEGLVYKEFDRNVHIYDQKEIRTIKKIIGVDFGFRNPAAVMEIHVDYDNHYWVVSEWYKTEKLNEEIIQYCKTLNANEFYPDPAEPDRIEEMRRAGLNIREVSKDVEKGIDSVRNLLKQNRLHIHKSCENLAWEFETYRYKETRADSDESESPEKKSDHALDAIRYPLFMQEPVIEDIDQNFNLYGIHYK